VLALRGGKWSEGSDEGKQNHDSSEWKMIFSLSLCYKGRGMSCVFVNHVHRIFFIFTLKKENLEVKRFEGVGERLEKRERERA
jgi:hypothetical protein